MVLVRADRVEGGARPRGIVSVDAQERLTGFRTTEAPVEGWVNAGVYVLDTAMVRGWPAGAYSFEEHVLSLVPEGDGVVFCSDQRLLDIGTPACYAHAQDSGLAGAMAS
jgi:NDP-sugar pyrophosphorylase family protein